MCGLQIPEVITQKIWRLDFFHEGSTLWSCFRDSSHITDGVFSHRKAGSFFDVDDLPAGSYEVGPPYTEEVPVLPGRQRGRLRSIARMKVLIFSGLSKPWKPTTFIFRGYNPCIFTNVYIQAFKPSFFMVLGSKGSQYV